MHHKQDAFTGADQNFVRNLIGMRCHGAHWASLHAPLVVGFPSHAQAWVLKAPGVLGPPPVRGMVVVPPAQLGALAYTSI